MLCLQLPSESINPPPFFSCFFKWKGMSVSGWHAFFAYFIYTIFSVSLSTDFTTNLHAFPKNDYISQKERKEILLLPAWFAGDVQASVSLFTGAQPLDVGKIWYFPDVVSAQKWSWYLHFCLPPFRNIRRHPAALTKSQEPELFPSLFPAPHCQAKWTDGRYISVNMVRQADCLWIYSNPS